MRIAFEAGHDWVRKSLRGNPRAAVMTLRGLADGLPGRSGRRVSPAEAATLAIHLRAKPC